TISRDSSGHADEIVGPFGQKNELSYDANGALESVAASVDEASGATRAVHFEYDDVTGLLSKFERPENDITRYSFDDLGRVETVTDALGVVETYTDTGSFFAPRVAV